MADYNIQDFGLRLKQARVRAKLSMEALAKMMGGNVTKQAISKYEKGQMAPSSSVLIALANALNSTLDYFFRPITPEMQNLEVSFRKKSSIGVKDAATLKINIQDDIERFLEIEAILGESKTAPRIIESIGTLSNASQMVEQAISIRKAWKLGNMPITNIQETLESNGIKVIFIEGPSGFDGVSGKVNDNNLIMVLNTKVDMVERRRFTALHELAHLLFNEFFDVSLSKHEHEKLCDAFANEMLIPSEVLRDIFDGKKRISFEELIYVQKLYGISIKAITYKLQNMGIMSEKRYRSFNIKINSDPEFKEKVNRSRFEEKKTHRFEAMVYGALASELITESKAASLLHVPLDTIHKNLTLV